MVARLQAGAAEWDIATGGGMMAPLFNAEAFATQVRVLMARKHITMREAAVEIGCGHATVSRVCNGKTPDVENYLRISKWLSEATTQEPRNG
ncbi:hypothetical protein ASE63_22590 [Bosea sp. Root381]|uniref:helix-turn-helix domain-containing protein n=1 Tax=Bosea sp. Root381 TaxID=1736524 RepID=UPI000701B330|nr:helix-turn-helix transcriptional regulator [Bosea sp. Root381]KRE07490.1 hypothetical protein ASE63_22590 [Bosea sp. Root381]